MSSTRFTAGGNTVYSTPTTAIRTRASDFEIPEYMSAVHNGSWKDDGSLPNNWEELIDTQTGRQYFVDHNTQTTSWVDPRDVFFKPFEFEECTGDEFPFGWESAYDATCGEYYIDHRTWSTTLHDPRTGTVHKTHGSISATNTHQQLVRAEGDLIQMQEALNKAPPLSERSIHVQNRITAHLRKVRSLEEQLENELYTAEQGNHRVEKEFMADQENYELFEATKKIRQLLQAHEEHRDTMSSRIEELENENMSVKERLNQMKSSTDLSLRSPAALDQDHKNKLLEQAKKIGRSLKSAADTANTDTKKFTPSHPLPLNSRTTTTKESVLLSAVNLGRKLEDANRIASGVDYEHEGRMVTPPNALPQLATETPYFTPHMLEASTPISPSNSPWLWDEKQVHSWMVDVAQQPDLAQTMLNDRMTGRDMLSLQFHDLVEYAVSSSEVAERLLLQITELLVSDPITSKIPLPQWEIFHVRHWLLRIGLGHRCGTFQQCSVDGKILGKLRLSDLRDMRITRKDETSAILNFLQEQTGSKPGPGRGWIEMDASAKKSKAANWSSEKVGEWLKKTHRSRLILKFSAAEIDGTALMHLQRSDLLRFGIKDGFEVNQFLMDVTSLVMIDPVDEKIPFKDWNRWQIRSWLLRNGKVAELAVLFKVQATGETMLTYTHHDLKDLGIIDLDIVINILTSISSAAREPVPPRQGSLDWKRLAKLRRPNVARVIEQTRGSTV